MRIEEGQPHYNVSEEPLVIHKATIDRILSLDHPAEALALYSFYYYTAKWQSTNQVKAVESYCMSGLKIGRVSFRRAKKALKDLGLIDDIQKVSKGKVKAHYVLVKFVKFSSHTAENDPVNQTAENELVQNMPTNALNTNNRNALNTNNRNALNTNKEDGFAEWYELYPRKVDKKKALNAWKNKNLYKIKDKLIEDIKKRKKVQFDFVEKNFIPHPTTYLNGERWEDEIEDKTGPNQQEEKKTSDYLKGYKTVKDL